MYSLFWKIFFTFWAIILIIEFFTAWVTADLSEYEIHPILEQQNAQFVASSTQMVSVLTSEGLPGLRSWMANNNNLKGIDEIYVIDKYHQEVNFKPLPDSVKAILKSDYNKQTLVNHFQPIKHTLTFKTTTPNNEDYLLISIFEHPPLVKYLLAPQRVALSVIISGLICFMLARYFTSPLTNLRRSTQMLTSGEFDTTNLLKLRKRSDEFGALAVDFNQMSERLSDLLDTQRQLLRDISHELYSPLARIRVALGLARNKYISMDSQELDRIETEIERLESLIRELLTFVKIEPNGKATTIEQIDLRELFNYIIEDAQYEQKQPVSKQKLELHCPKGLELYADARLLHRALENIVRNARYYSPNNATITIRCHQDSQNVCISIDDEGPGVPQDMLDKIFQPFVRVSKARETETGGSGIGLALAKRVIEIHDGFITAENKRNGNGLIVNITLPRTADPAVRLAAS